MSLESEFHRSRHPEELTYHDGERRRMTTLEVIWRLEAAIEGSRRDPVRYVAIKKALEKHCRLLDPPSIRLSHLAMYFPDADNPRKYAATAFTSILEKLGVPLDTDYLYEVG